MITRCIAFGGGVVVKIPRGNRPLVVIDVFAGLLPTNPEYLAEMPRCQPSLPQNNNFDEPITQQLLPSQRAHAVVAGVVSSAVTGFSLRLIFTIPVIACGV